MSATLLPHHAPRFYDSIYTLTTITLLTVSGFAISKPLGDARLIGKWEVKVICRNYEGTYTETKIPENFMYYFTFTANTLTFGLSDSTDLGGSVKYEIVRTKEHIAIDLYDPDIKGKVTHYAFIKISDNDLDMIWSDKKRPTTFSPRDMKFCEKFTMKRCKQ